jgi:hypothetical protein
VGRKPGVARPDKACGDIGLAIARDGTWSYQGSPIRRKPLVKLFASVLRREADGLYFLVTPVERVPIAVEEAPFLAVELVAEGRGPKQRLKFRTNLDDIVIAGPGRPLRFRYDRDGRFAPFVFVRDGLEAKLARPVYYELATLAEEAEGRLGVWSGGVFFPFPAEGSSGG